MEEKRKHKRFNIASYAESEVYAAAINEDNLEIDIEKLIPQSFFLVYDRNTENVVGHLLDISIGGFMIIGKVPFEKNNVYQFKMDFSSVMNCEQQIPFDVRCAWMEKTLNIEYYITGFEFTKIYTEHIDIIKQLIERYDPYE